MKRKILSVVKVVVPWHFLPHPISFFVILDNCSTCTQIFQKSRYQGGALNKIYSNHVRNKIEFADSIKFLDSSFIIQDFKTENYSKVRNIHNSGRDDWGGAVLSQPQKISLCQYFPFGYSFIASKDTRFAPCIRLSS